MCFDPRSCWAGAEPLGRTGTLVVTWVDADVASKVELECRPSKEFGGVVVFPEAREEEGVIEECPTTFICASNNPSSKKL